MLTVGINVKNHQKRAGLGNMKRSLKFTDVQKKF